MAHTCPSCHQYCHCQADIDDLDFGERWDCICCDGRDDYEDNEYDYDDEGLTTTPPIKPPPSIE